MRNARERESESDVGQWGLSKAGTLAKPQQATVLTSSLSSASQTSTHTSLPLRTFDKTFLLPSPIPSFSCRPAVRCSVTAFATYFLGLPPPGTPLFAILNRLPSPTLPPRSTFGFAYYLSGSPSLDIWRCLLSVCPSTRPPLPLRIRPRPGHSRRTLASERPRLMQTWVTASANFALIITFIEPVFKR